jgi:hypothetical protein
MEQNNNDIAVMHNKTIKCNNAPIKEKHLLEPEKCINDYEQNIVHKSNKEISAPRLSYEVIRNINNQMIREYEQAAMNISLEPYVIPTENHYSTLSTNDLFDKEDQDFSLIIVGNFHEGVYEEYQKLCQKYGYKSYLINEEGLKGLLNGKDIINEQSLY